MDLGGQVGSGDAKVLADLVRTDRHNHRPVAGDRDLAEAVRVLARAISRPSGAVTASSTPAVSAAGLLPGGPGSLRADLATGDALAVLPLGPTPEPGRQRSRAQLVAALHRGGRQGNRQARATQIQAALGAPQLTRLGRAAMPLGWWPRPPLGCWSAATSRSAAWRRHWARVQPAPGGQDHPLLPGLGWSWAPGCWASSAMTKPDSPPPSLPRTMPAAHQHQGLGPLAGRARPSCPPPPARRCAGAVGVLHPITRSPGARRYYDQLRARNKTHRQALRQLANRWVGILHPCRDRGVLYAEHLAWSHLQPMAA
jgi:hypothetical protein